MEGWLLQLSCRVGRGFRTPWGETFIKRYVVETTNKTEIRPEDEQSENAESFRDNLCSEIQLKGPQRQKQTQEHVRRSGQARLVYVKDINRDITTTRKWARGDLIATNTSPSVNVPHYLIVLKVFFFGQYFPLLLCFSLWSKHGSHSSGFWAEYQFNVLIG